ncbi:MAG: D-amino-acid transaminase [Beijerinckiaceae bacterium]
MQRYAYVDGRYVPAEDARVSIFDRGFLFGDGVYEVTAVLDGRLVDSALHLDRLERSLGEIGISAPATRVQIIAIERELIARNALAEGLVYLQVTRGAAERDFLPPKEAKPTLVLFTQEKAIVASKSASTGITVKSVADLRWARRDIKSIGLLAQVIAKEEARLAGCNDAFLVEEGGFITEAASSSVFIVTGEGSVVTRHNSHDILPSCTRLATLALARERGIAIEERRFTVEEACSAREVFITSATNFVMPVVAIDGHKIASGTPGPLTLRLREIYIETARRTAQ